MESKEDEDISIDFGKIKNFFKSAKKEEQEADEKKAEGKPAETAEIKKDEDVELSFDFSKIKKFFKPGENAESGDDGISINWDKAAGFFRTYGIIFLALIPIILSIYIRMQAGYLPVTDDWAQNSVINSIKSQIKASIDQQYPNLPDANKNALVDTELQKLTLRNSQQINDQIRATSDYFRSFFQDETGKNYMPDIDPYYWFRYSKNIVDHGNPGDEIRDGMPYDNHQLAPLGRPVASDMFPSYFLAYFYRFLHFFAPDMTLMRSMFYYPVFISALCVLLVFLIARKIAGNIGGFFAGLMMAVNAAFLGRTLFGHADSDAWVVFFPLLITWLFVLTIDLKSTLKIAIIALLSGFFTGLFTFAWGGWWYISDFLFMTIFLTFLYLVLANFDEIRKNPLSILNNTSIRRILVVGIVYFVSSAAFVSLFIGWHSFISSFLGPLGFSSIKEPVSSNLWPNVLTTVAELNEGSINGIINSIGGPFLFFMSLIGLVMAVSRSEGLRRFDFFYIIGSLIFYGMLFIKFGANAPLYQSISIISLLIWIILPIIIRILISVYKKDSSYDFKLSILLSLWVISTIFASVKGIRFTLLLAPAFSVAFGIAIGKIYIYLLRLLTKELKIQKFISVGILIALLLFIFYVNPTKAAIDISGSDLPIVNDAWYNDLKAINQNSSSDAIITSWWDFGHHFKALADRRVTFDGTTQTSPAAHWVGKLLMSNNELQAVGILRMLDCGSNSAFDEIYKINNDTHLAIRILNEIIVLDKKGAEKRLKELDFKSAQIEKILSFTHCEPPEAYFIASEDMVGKSGVWSHFGSWNFERAEIWQSRKLPKEEQVSRMQREYNYSREKAENIYSEVQSISSDSEANAWVSPWPGYGGMASCSINSKGIYVCANGFMVNLSSYDIYAVGQQGIVRPKIAAFTTETGIFSKTFNGTTVDLGITLIPKSENEIEAVLSSKELTGSMFTRMFYMQGHGLKYFKLFDRQRGLTGTNIYTYKVDWEGKNEDIVQDYLNFFKKTTNSS